MNLPAGPFGAILADPPWRFKTFSALGRGRCPDGPATRAESRTNNPARHYETMSLEEIAWGFTFKTIGFVWAKERRITSGRHKLHADPDNKRFPIGTGYWTRANPELCLLFTRGKPKRLSAAVRKLIIAPRREHSRKPDETHARIEALVAGPYLELFAREERPGWTVWGNETSKFERKDAA